MPERNRLHLDVTATDRDQDEQVQRLVGLGARPVDLGQGDDTDGVMLADPEGNEFGVLRERRPWAATGLQPFETRATAFGAAGRIGRDAHRAP